HAAGLTLDSLLQAALEKRAFEIPGLPSEFERLDPTWFREGVEPRGYAHSFPLRFLGPPSQPGEEGGTFNAYTASEVPVLATFSPEWFRDKIVLIGTGFHDSDKFRSPFYGVALANGGQAGWTYGVEIHANALMNLLHREYVRPAGLGRELALLVLVSALATAVVFWRGAGWGAPAAVLLLAGVAGYAVFMFLGKFELGRLVVADMDRSLVWVPVISPFLATLLSYLGSTAYVSVVEGKEKRFIRSAFGKYVSPQVVAEIADRPEMLRLGGAKRELTLLFSDLAGFTNLSENMDPEHLVSLLNEYLDDMTRIVLKEGGTLDKYIGDAIMAFWNAPKEQPDHADRGLRCAIRMQHRLAELNRRWLKQGRADGTLQVRIGINTGVAVVGNVGGTERFDFSAIGDSVNLAARLEPANKTYGTLVMASEFTVRVATFEAYRMRELDYIAVKGKSRPVRVYEVIGLAEEAIAPERTELLKHYDQGLAAYHRRDWELAERYFQAALEIDPEDGPSRLYLERIQECMVNPPPADWDFVVRRTVK
ncbi:MAG: CHASE2 domain-containing protein, partial [Gemmatimonadetes bacterium]|nr:CHASE2 domain-containing protein [Gemmatimonadota bacterium]